MVLALALLAGAAPARAQQDSSDTTQQVTTDGGQQIDNNLTQQNNTYVPYGSMVVTPPGPLTYPPNQPNGSHFLQKTFSQQFQWYTTTQTPPQTAYFKVVSQAYVYYGTGNGCGQPVADDGYGDPASPVPDYGSFYSMMSGGTHLLQMQGQSIITVTATLTAGIQTGSGEINAKVAFSVVPDTRGIEISSAVDPTFSKDSNGNCVENVPGPDGTLYGDTYLPEGITEGPDGPTFYMQSIEYNATAVGSWYYLGTTWHWYDSLGQGSAQGDYPNIQQFAPLIWDAYLAGGDEQDHVFISMYDGLDGAEATANYYMRIHQKWEPVSWPVDETYKVMGTDPYVPTAGWPTYSWQLVPNGVPVVGPSSGTLAFSYSASGFKDYNCGLSLSIADLTAEFSTLYQPENEVTATSNYSVSPGYGEEDYPVWRYDVTRQMGYLDQYNAHGYVGPDGQGAWCQDTTDTIDTYYYEEPTDAPASNPPSTWNPPGYD